MKRIFGDALISAGVVAMVLTVLVSVDVRVREQFNALVNPASVGTPHLGGTWANAGSALVEALTRQSLDHAPLMIFVVVAVGLVLAMTRN